MPGHRLARIGSLERRTERELGDVQSVKREHVVMNALVVPRRTRAIVAVVLAGHVLVAREPPRVVVDALPGATRRLRSGLASGCNRARELAARDRPAVRRQIADRPVEELYSRQRG